MPDKQVNRTLYCYSLVLTPKPGMPGLSWNEVFQRFIGISEDNLYKIDGTTDALLVVGALTDNEVRGHFNWLRYDCPRILNVQHRLERFITLAPEENLMERAHFKYFPEHDVFVAEYNHYGARTFSRFGPYIVDRVSELEKCELRPYVRTDAFERAGRQAGSLRKIIVSAVTPAIPVLEEAFSLGVSETLGDLSTIATEFQIDISLSTRRRNKTLPITLQEKISEFVERLRDSIGDRYGFNRIKLVGDEPTPIDLLRSDYFHGVKVCAVEENSRVVREADIYTAIDSFYHEHVKEDLPILRIGG